MLLPHHSYAKSISADLITGVAWHGVQSKPRPHNPAAQMH